MKFSKRHASMRRRSALFATLVTLAMTASIADARDGDVDRRFGVDGKAFPAYPSNHFIDSAIVELARLAGDKLLLTSSRRYTIDDYDFSALRLLSDGSIDPTFAFAGQASFAFDRAGSNLGDHVVGVAVQPNGRIVLGGSAAGDATTGDDMAFVRLLENGTIDMSFGTAGSVVVPFNLGTCVSGGCADQATRLNLQADGRLLVAGVASTDDGMRMAVARLTASGQRDTSFDVDGRLTVQFGTGNIGRAYRARQLADGTHIVVVGAANTTSESANQDFVAARLNADGSLDAGFGIGGKLVYAFDIGGNLGDAATDFVELADGKLLLCGQVQVNNPANYDFGCMRFLANGIADPAFTPMLIPFDAGGELADVPFRIEIDARGRFLLVGAAAVGPGNYDFAVARLMPDGALDTTFGTGGVKTFDSLPGTLATERSNIATAVVIAPDDTIVIAGYTDVNTAGDKEFELVRMIGDTLSSDGFD